MSKTIIITTWTCWGYPARGTNFKEELVAKIGDGFSFKMETAELPRGNFTVKLVNEDGSDETLHCKIESGSYPDAEKIAEILKK